MELLSLHEAWNWGIQEIRFNIPWNKTRACIRARGQYAGFRSYDQDFAVVLCRSLHTPTPHNAFRSWDDAIREKKQLVKARLHMRFLMRFLVRFRVQNAPYPTLHEYFFREASRGLERKLSHIISRHPSFQFLLTWRYFVAELRDYKPVRGRLWQVLFAKSHRNRMKNRMCKRAFTELGKGRQGRGTDTRPSRGAPCMLQEAKHEIWASWWKGE